MQQDVVDLLECPNCSTPLSRRYCPHCGQKVSDVNPTIHDLLHDCGTWPVAVGRTAVVLTCYTIVIAAASVLLILFTAHELI